jgi:hypothetical protein
MELKSLIAAIPFLRRLWAWLPGPLRIVVVLLAAVVALYRLLSDEPESGDTTEAM